MTTQLVGVIKKKQKKIGSDSHTPIIYIVSSIYLSIIYNQYLSINHLFYNLCIYHILILLFSNQLSIYHLLCIPSTIILSSVIHVLFMYSYTSPSVYLYKNFIGNSLHDKESREFQRSLVYKLET